MEQDVTAAINFSHICIEGVIGAGKTSLCHLLAQRLNAQLVLEQAEENPFLTRFYQDRSSFAFQTQLWFLTSRYRQLTDSFSQHSLFHSITVADYMFAKDTIFANVNLDEHELALYNQIYRVLVKNAPRPEFVVYLQASTETLLRRIDKRGRPYEFNMAPDYIDLLNNAYNQFFFNYTNSPLLIINTNEIDFVNNEGDLEELAAQIMCTQHGTTFYQPLGEKTRRALDKQAGAPVPLP